MIAFYKTEEGKIVKFFDQGNDWQVKDSEVERWFSQWSNDRKGSLISAATKFLKERYSEQLRPEELVIC